MLSYRHAFHAGNYADVLKHTVLCQILQYVVQKEKPIMYLDTHAGAGSYDLTSDKASKTDEFIQGIGALWGAKGDLPGALSTYLQCVQSFNPKELVCYPGSPQLAKYWLRAQDRMILCEKHPFDIKRLQNVFSKNKRVFCEAEDGYQKALAVLPPIEKRGVILIDPSYEVKSEYFDMATYIEKYLRRFATGIYCIWYPVAHPEKTSAMLKKMTKAVGRPMSLFEIGYTEHHNSAGMTGTGMIVINPPWSLQNAMQRALPAMVDLMCPGGYWKSEVLVGES